MFLFFSGTAALRKYRVAAIHIKVMPSNIFSYNINVLEFYDAIIFRFQNNFTRNQHQNNTKHQI